MLNENEERLTLETAIEPFERDLAVVADPFRAVMARVAEIIKPIIEALVNFAIFAYMADRHPKWWHYYRHAKRRRIRKKYRDKLLREMIETLEKGDCFETCIKH